MTGVLMIALSLLIQHVCAAEDEWGAFPPDSNETFYLRSSETPALDGFDDSDDSQPAESNPEMAEIASKDALEAMGVKPRTFYVYTDGSRKSSMSGLIREGDTVFFPHKGDIGPIYLVEKVEDYEIRYFNAGTGGDVVIPMTRVTVGRDKDFTFLTVERNTGLVTNANDLKWTPK